ncbi:MAG: hypothetical protein ACWIPJ_09470 [Polaribacter sp.]
MQTNLVWENSTKNCSFFQKQINTLNTDVDLLMLPEMFTTDFTMNPNLADKNSPM